MTSHLGHRTYAETASIKPSDNMVAAPYPRYGVPFRPLITVLALALASAPLLRSRKSIGSPLHSR